MWRFVSLSSHGVTPGLVDFRLWVSSKFRIIFFLHRTFP